MGGGKSKSGGITPMIVLRSLPNVMLCPMKLGCAPKRRCHRPWLKIATRCTLTDRFLVVRGKLRTYKIHLGSGNILMEPNDQYLCIVPARSPAAVGTDRLFLPFEGDATLSIILSKAFLLAADDTVKDPTIVRQISLR